MKKVLLTALTLTSMTFADITWQTAVEQSLSPAPSSSNQNLVTADAAGNVLNTITYLSGGSPIITTSIHAASGTSWGALSNLNTTNKAGLKAFPGATNQFVVVISDIVANTFTSRTISTTGTVGSAKTVAGTTVSPTPAITAVAAGPTGNAILAFASNNAQVSYNAIYTASSDSWTVNPTSTDQGTTIIQHVAAADSGGNYMLAADLLAGEGKYAVKIGSNNLTTYTAFDTGITDGSLSLAAQVKETDTDGLFLLAYIKSNNVFAQIKAAGSSTSLTDLGQISTTGDTLDTFTRSAMNKNGDGVVAWITDDSKLIAAKYSASSNTFADPITIETDANGLANVTSDSNGDFHIFYEVGTGSVVTMTSVTMSSTSSTWNTPVTVYANASGADIANAVASGNPRGTKMGYVWDIDTSLEHFAAFGSVSASGGNHGAPSAGGLFRKGKSGLRPGRKPYR